MTYVSWFNWLEATSLGTVVRKSTYLFPAIEVVHLLGLTLLLGAVIAINLKLFGVILRERPLAQVSKDFSPLFWTGFGVTIFTGTVLFLAEAVKCYYNVAFLYKMILLVVAVVFHVSIHRKARHSQNWSAGALKAAAAASLALWFGVGIAGRFIGFI